MARKAAGGQSLAGAQCLGEGGALGRRGSNGTACERGQVCVQLVTILSRWERRLGWWVGPQCLKRVRLSPSQSDGSPPPPPDCVSARRRGPGYPLHSVWRTPPENAWSTHRPTQGTVARWQVMPLRCGLLESALRSVALVEVHVAGGGGHVSSPGRTSKQEATQGEGGGARGGERLMGTAACRGNGVKERGQGVSGDRPLGAARIR